MALAVGLTGKMTATSESEALIAKINDIVKVIGKYPHKKLDYTNRKKQSTRNLKIECVNHPHDPYFVRMSRTMYEKAAPLCGICGAKMTDDPISAEIDKIQKAVKVTEVTKEENRLLESLAHSEFSDEDIERGDAGGGGYINEWDLKIAQSLKNKGVIQYEKMENTTGNPIWGWINDHYNNSGKDKDNRIINIVEV